MTPCSMTDTLTISDAAIDRAFIGAQMRSEDLQLDTCHQQFELGNARLWNTRPGLYRAASTCRRPAIEVAAIKSSSSLGRPSRDPNTVHIHSPDLIARANVPSFTVIVRHSGLWIVGLSPLILLARKQYLIRYWRADLASIDALDLLT